MPKLSDGLIQEIEQEAVATRKCLERIPDDRLSWKPHDKSYSLGQLALHVAEGIGGIARMLQGDSFDFGDFTQEEPATKAALLAAFEADQKTAKEVLSGWDDAKTMGIWKASKGGKEFMSLPRIAALRGFGLSHTVHHRGALSVYLRLLNIPVPAIYGPSADENPFA